ncbi:MAG: dihydroorotate dehydrogenase-like protein [Ktedonobacterales bacterium]|nr:dihydroorotate dehydrogenase-like protein [Ktedonobacterales bacterium]
MPDLSTTYLGMQLRAPLVASASPLSKRVDTVKRLAAAGAGAVFLYSLFEEQITHDSLELDHYLSYGSHSYAESLSYFPDLEHYNIGPASYLDHIRRLKDAVDIPIIGSLNGVSSGGWVEYAARMQEAGADAVELNIYYIPTDVQTDGATLEATYVELVRDVCAQVTIPIAVKLSPYFTALPAFCQRIVAAGASGLVLFNRFYQPDLDLERLEVVPRIDLSTSQDLRLPLRWIALLYGRLRADLALTSGVHTAQDALKGLMAGANVTMLASRLIIAGPDALAELLSEIHIWLVEHEYESITQLRGSMSQRAVADPAAFERANYMKALNSFDASPT